MLNVRCFLLKLADKLSASLSNRLLSRAIRAGAIKINQNVARLGLMRARLHALGGSSARVTACRRGSVHPLLRAPILRVDERFLPPFCHDKHHPTETDRDNILRTTRLLRSDGQISNSGRWHSSACFADRVAGLSFLVVMRVLAVLSAKDDGTRILRVAKFPMGTFATRHAQKSSGFKVRNQLSNLARHNLTQKASVCSWLPSNLF